MKSDNSDELFIDLMISNPDVSWRANNNIDGRRKPGHFVAGINFEKAFLFSYIRNELWEKLDNYGISTSNRAPEFYNNKNTENI